MPRRSGMLYQTYKSKNRQSQRMQGGSIHNCNSYLNLSTTTSHNICICVHAQSLSHVDSLRPQRLQPTRVLRPWDFPGKNAAVGCHFLLQGIFSAQGSNHASCTGRQKLPIPLSLAQCHCPGSSSGILYSILKLSFIYRPLIESQFLSSKHGYNSLSLKI